MLAVYVSIGVYNMLFKKNKKASAEKRGTQKIGKELDFASAEAYNLLRTNLSFSLPDNDSGKVIGITSPCPQEGKSTTSLNLAYSLAEAGNAVLLIDADMRRPSVCKMLDLSKSPGLSNLLAEDPENAMHTGVLSERLTVLLSGDVPPNPSELIVSEKMKKLIEEFRNQYNYVIVDLPPVLSVSDPLAMSRNIDGMIVVVRHGHTKRGDVVETMRQLKLVNINVLGFVYNGALRNKPSYSRS